ncbi:MAG: alpha/beta hydrolase [Flavobacterium sp.]|nr:alpha/beta hydrolase [Pedobacter sp.]
MKTLNLTAYCAIVKKQIIFPALAILAISACNNPSRETTMSDSMNNDQTAMNDMDTSANTGMTLKPTGTKPEWAPSITAPMQTVLEKLGSYKDPDLTTLSATDARKQHSPADAVMDLIKENNITIPAATVDTTGKNIPVNGGNIHLRVYTPKTGNGPFPIIVYYHGGGWVIANLDTYNSSAQALAEQAGAVLVSVAYRQAPEYKFPTAHNDSYAAYEWVLKNAASIKGDPKKVALVGESAGGNLAASVSMMAREKGAALPLHQVLIYPIAGYDLNTESYKKYAEAKPLNKPLMGWFFENYLKSPVDGKSPMISLVTANLKGMPATTIINAELDPLFTEGGILSDQFKAAGVPVTRKVYDGVTHEFFGMAAVLPQAKEAQALAVSELKKAFNK